MSAPAEDQPKQDKPSVTWWADKEDAISISSSHEDAGADQEKLGPRKRHVKKFQRNFKQVAAQEPLLYCFSCLYGGERIHQGHLYITQNYFAFRSNVFGYVTKILIPTALVKDIKLEKTAKIIPNAIGLTTQGGQYVFSFLRSRKTAYRLMVELWQNALNSAPQEITEENYAAQDTVDGGEDEGETSDEDPPFSSSDHACPPYPADCITDSPNTESRLRKRSNDEPSQDVAPLQQVGLATKASVQTPGTSLVLKLSLFLALFLGLTSVYLVYRICRLYLQSPETPPLDDSDSMYRKIYDWQTQMHEQSVSAVEDFLKSHMSRLSKVKRNLDISSLRDMVEEDESKT